MEASIGKKCILKDSVQRHSDLWVLGCFVGPLNFSLKKESLQLKVEQTLSFINEKYSDDFAVYWALGVLES